MTMLFVLLSVVTGTIGTWTFRTWAFALTATLPVLERRIETHHFPHLTGTQVFAELVVEFGLDVSQLLKTFKSCLG